MYPEPLFYINDTGVTGYLLAFAGGPLPALLLLLYLGRERGLGWRTVVDAAFIAGGLTLAAGSLFSLWLAEMIHDFPMLWSLLFMSLFAACIWLFFWRLPATRQQPGIGADIFFPALALYLAIFRIGCFMAGCDHGSPAWDAAFSITVTHPQSSTIYRGVPIHPAQLYQSLGNFAIMVILLAVRNRPSAHGRLTWFFFLLYGVLRFGVEFVRGDPRWMVGPLSVNQIVCLLFIVVGLIGWRGFALYRKRAIPMPRAGIYPTEVA